MLSEKYEFTTEEFQAAKEVYAKTIEGILQQTPELTNSGFVCHNKAYEGTDWGYFKSRLLEDPDNALQFYLVSLWLEACIKTRSVSKGLSSYFLKGLVERQYGHYIGNGIFIAAALHCGFQVCRNPRQLSPNALIGIARSSPALKSPPYPSKQSVHD